MFFGVLVFGSYVYIPLPILKIKPVLFGDKAMPEILSGKYCKESDVLATLPKAVSITSPFKNVIMVLVGDKNSTPTAFVTVVFVILSFVGVVAVVSYMCPVALSANRITVSFSAVEVAFVGLVVAVLS
jgi:hypothetical protein